MNRILLTSFYLSFCIVQMAQAQSTKEILKTLKLVDSIQQVENFQAKHLDWDVEIILYDDSDTSLLKKMISLIMGETTVINQGKETFVLKAIKESEVKEYRVSYIFLSGQDLSTDQIDSLQKTIIKQYHDGVPFDELARNYSMDGNAERGGDIGWFTPENMVKEFSEPVKSHGYKEIFTIDIPSRAWFYVVLKTYPDRQRMKTALIKVKSSR